MLIIAVVSVVFNIAFIVYFVGTLVTVIGWLEPRGFGFQRVLFGAY
jgi:hypothetical protein